MRRDSRTFFPTAERKAQLRREGIVPVSSAALRYALFSMLLLTALFGTEKIIQALTFFFDHPEPATFYILAGKILAVLVFGSALTVLFVGLLQSRSIGSLYQLKFDAGRLFAPVGLLGGMVGVLGNLISISLLLFIAYLLLGLVSNVWFRILIVPPSALLPALTFGLRKLLSWGAGICLFAAVFAAVYHWAAFQFAHRMTKAEVEWEMESDK